MKIVLSYRRNDSQAIAGWISEKLAQHFGQGNVFRDIDSIPPSVDFRKHIQNELTHCDVMLAIIGRQWLGEDGNPRINDETDFVRFEVETALRLNIPVVPVLVDGAKMPQPNQLPESIKDFAFTNAVEVSSGLDFRSHMERLIRSLERLLNDRYGSRGNHEIATSWNSSLAVKSMLCGIASGVLSAISYYTVPITAGTFLKVDFQPYLGPGFIFGLSLCVVLFMIVREFRASMLIVIGSMVIIWIASYNLALLAGIMLHDQSVGLNKTTACMIGGMIGGGLGSSLVSVSVYLFLRKKIQYNRLLAMTLTGALSGLLVYSDNQVAPVLIVWQPLVMWGIIVWVLGEDQRSLSNRTAKIQASLS